MTSLIHRYSYFSRRRGLGVNSRESVNADNQTATFALYHISQPPGQLDVKFINCHFDLYNCRAGGGVTFLYRFFPPSGASGVLLQNCIISFAGSADHWLNLLNTPLNLTHNAYLFSTANDFTRDPGRVDLRPFGRPPVGVAPGPSSPLYSAGANGPYVLEFDRYLRTRGRLRTIGPVMGPSGSSIFI